MSGDEESDDGASRKKKPTGKAKANAKAAASNDEPGVEKGMYPVSLQNDLDLTSPTKMTLISLETAGQGLQEIHKRERVPQQGLRQHPRVLRLGRWQAAAGQERHLA